MLSYRDRTLRLSLELGDTAVAVVSLLAAAMVGRLASFGAQIGAQDVLVAACVAGVLGGWTLTLCGAHEPRRIPDLRSGLGSISRGWALGVLGILAAGPALGLATLSLPISLLYAGFSLAGLLAFRAAAARWVRGPRRTPFRRPAFLVLGSDSRAGLVASRLVETWGFRNLGFLDDDPLSLDVKALGDKYLGSTKELERLLEQEVLDEAVIVVPREQLGSDSIRTAMNLCDSVGVDVTIVSDLLEARRAKPTLHHALGVPALNFGACGPRPVWALMLKRGVDLVGAVVGLALTLPFWVVIAVLIKLDSPGPIFFVQSRCGLHGRVFRFLKFRTMHRDAERQLESLRAYNEVTGPVFKMGADPRVTGVGRLLRLSSLDELPQLINVLLGQMSLVGPRPPTPGEVERYTLAQRRRLSVKPGLTCLWQVSGRSQLHFDDWVRLDLEYIDRWSLFLDLAILLRTVPAVLTAKGAS